MKRTKKTFTDYNEYHDRPFALKWRTAFAMDELVQGIKKNEVSASRELERLPQMTLTEIDQRLSEACLYQKQLEIQLNVRDELGRVQPSIKGYFQGETYDDYFVISEQFIFWEDVRHLRILEPKKWFELDVLSSNTPQNKNGQSSISKKEPNELTRIKN